MTPRGNGPSYGVHMSQRTRAHLRKLHVEANEVGKGPAFVTAFRRIVERLQNDPWTFGEPSYRLPAVKLQVRKAVVGPLAVDYGVHEEKPLVFIRGFKTLL